MYSFNEFIKVIYTEKINSIDKLLISHLNCLMSVTTEFLDYKALQITIFATFLVANDVKKNLQLNNSV